MSRASARELRLASRAVKAARTHLSNADATRELIDGPEKLCFVSLLHQFERDIETLKAMAARAEARQVRPSERAA